MTSFHKLNLSTAALSAVSSLGYDTPTPIQTATIPVIATGMDVIASAKTGTGKTAAFALPALDSIAGTDRSRTEPKALVVTPTRELASQVEKTCRIIARELSLRAVCIVGGVDPQPQIEKLSAGTDVLIGTPGRIIDLVQQGACDLSGIAVLVLDEADQLLDMGFLPQVKQIVGACPQKRQTLLFSATLDQSVRNSFQHLLQNPVFVEVDRKGDVAAKVEQYAIKVDHRCKPKMLAALLKHSPRRRTIIFARTKRRVDTCLDHLLEWGYPAVSIHSGKSQAQRRAALADFANGKTRILVATDVIARGIHISDVDLVLNYDVPVQAEDYVHRVGRTGRAGAEGLAVTFVTPETQKDFESIEALVGTRMPFREAPGRGTEENERALARKATQKNAKHDPELAAAAREYEQRLKKAQKRKESRKEAAGSEAGRARQNGRTGAKKSGKQAGKALPRPAQRKAQNGRTRNGKPRR